MRLAKKRLKCYLERQIIIDFGAWVKLTEQRLPLLRQAPKRKLQVDLAADATAVRIPLRSFIFVGGGKSV